MKEITLEELRYFKGIANGCLREITDVDTHNAFKKILDINIIEGHGFYILNTNIKNNISKCFNSMGGSMKYLQKHNPD